MLSGLGVATADAAYGAVAAFGLAAIAGLLVGEPVALRLVGAVVLVYLGVDTLRAPAGQAPAVGGTRLAGMYVSTLALTLTNPTTILSFAALFASLGLGEDGRDPSTAPALVLGVFLGSALWWLLLTGGIALARQRLTTRLLALHQHGRRAGAAGSGPAGAGESATVVLSGSPGASSALAQRASG